MARVDVVAVLRRMSEQAMDSRIELEDPHTREERLAQGSEDDIAIAAVAELIAADVALDDLLQMPAQPESVPEFSAKVAAAKRRRAAAIAACKPATGAEK